MMALPNDSAPEHRFAGVIALSGLLQYILPASISNMRCLRITVPAGAADIAGDDSMWWKRIMYDLIPRSIIIIASSE
jgi:hypothetical protein